MSRQIGLFVDISDLYEQVIRQHKARRLNYEAYYDFVASLGSIQAAQAYGCQKSSEAEGFRTRLHHIGFKTKFKRPKMRSGKNGIVRAAWNVTIALDVVNKAEHINCLLLGSTDKELMPLIEWAQDNGILVIILACNIGRAMEKIADKAIEIPESLLC